METITDKKHSFLMTYYYQFFIVIVVAVSWFFGQDILGMGILIAIIVAVLVTSKDMLPALPPILMISFVISQQDVAVNYFDLFNSLLISAYGLALIVGFAVFFLRNKTKFRFGYMFLPLLLMSISLIIGGIAFDINLTLSSLPNSLIFLVVMVFMYLAFVNGIKSANRAYFAKIFVSVGLLLAFQVVTFYLRADNIELAITNKTLNLGWGMSNVIGSIMLFCLPITMYLAVNSKIKYYYLLIFYIELGVLIFSLSRGSLLIAGIGVPLLIAYSIKKMTKGRVLFLITNTIIIASTISIFLVVVPSTIDVAERLLNMGLNSSGRWTLYLRAIEDFLLSPIFGTSTGYMWDANDFAMFQYHDVLMQFAANSGIIGIIAFAFYTIRRYKLFCLPSYSINSYIFFAVTMWTAYTYLDCGMFRPYQMIMLVAMLVITEKNIINYDKWKLPSRSFGGINGIII